MLSFVGCFLSKTVIYLNLLVKFERGEHGRHAKNNKKSNKNADVQGY